MCCARPRDPPGSEPSRRDTSSHLLTAPGHHKPCLRGTKNEPSERRAEGILARSDFDRTHVRVDREAGSEQKYGVISTTLDDVFAIIARGCYAQLVTSAHEENRRTIPHGDRNAILLQPSCFLIDSPAGASDDGAVRARSERREPRLEIKLLAIVTLISRVGLKMSIYREPASTSKQSSLIRNP